MTSSLDHTALCNLQGHAKHFFCFSARSTQPETHCRLICGTLPQRSLRLTVYLMATSRDRLKSETARISRGHPHISFHNTHTFLFNYVTACAYFYMCVLCRESLMDGPVKGQYATEGDENMLWPGYDSKLHPMVKLQFRICVECGKLLEPIVIVPVWVLYMVQSEFLVYSNLIGPCAKKIFKKNSSAQKMYIWTWFSNLYRCISVVLSLT